MIIIIIIVLDNSGKYMQITHRLITKSRESHACTHSERPTPAQSNGCLTFNQTQSENLHVNALYRHRGRCST